MLLRYLALLFRYLYAIDSTRTILTTTAMIMTLHLIPILYLLSLTSTVTAKCQSFQPQYLNDRLTEYAFTATQRSFVASAVVNCSTAPGQTVPGQFTGNETMRCASNQCYLSVPPDYYVRVNRTLSIAVDAATEEDIFELVRSSFGDALGRTDLSATGVWPASQAATCINESMAAYWSFSPIYSCVEGNLTGCEAGGYPSDGTFVRACGVRGSTTGNRLTGGELSVVMAYGFENQPAPPNATEDVPATGGSSRGLRAELGIVLPFVVGLVVFLNLGL